MSLSLNVSFFFIISPSKHVFHCRFQRCAFVSAIIVLQQRGQDIVSCCLLDGVCGWRSIYTLSRTQVWVWWLGCLHSVEKYNLSSLEFELWPSALRQLGKHQSHTKSLLTREETNGKDWKDSSTCGTHML